MLSVDQPFRTFLQRVFGSQPPGRGDVRPGRRLHLLRARKPGLGLRADALPFQAHFRELRPHVVAGAPQVVLIPTSKRHNIYVLLQVPGYIVMTTGEIMLSITGLEFSYSQVSRDLAPTNSQ